MEPPAPSDIARVPESRCVKCDAVLNAVGTGQSDIEAKPEAGDITVCLKCGYVMRFDENLNFRELTDADRTELANDPEWLEEVLRMVERVHFANSCK